MSIESGVLYVVATPIGNLGDISARALAVLSSCDLILAEDTRHSAGLLKHFGIGTKCRALHDHNEAQLVERLVERIVQGDEIALISDAGTPLISDPGYRLVRALRERGVRVVSVPGPSAVLAALSVAGLATDRFVFEGFLPANAPARRTRLSALADETRTVVLFEAPHRIEACLSDAVEIMGADREAAIARELTKTFETVRLDALGALLDWVRNDADQRRGELVLMLAGDDSEHAAWRTAVRTLRELLNELPLKRAVSLAARLTGARKNKLYEQALRWQAENAERGKDVD